MWWSIVGIGGCCFVTSTDKKTALKGYEVWEDGEIRAWRERACWGRDREKELAQEAFVYKVLGEHPNILRCYGLEEVHPGINSLRLEYAPLGDVRKFIREHGAEPLAEHIRLQMALDTALGLSHLHAKGVQHCDLSCRNLLLFDDYRVKLGDFNGSEVEWHDEYKGSACEESAYELPLRGREFRDRPPRKRELFALGSAIYEIMAWEKPYEGLEDDDIEKKYAAEEFPSLHGIVAGSVIRMCWNEEFESADDVTVALRALISLHASDAGDVRTDSN